MKEALVAIFLLSRFQLRTCVPSLDLLRGLTSSQTDKNGSPTGAAHANVSALLEVGLGVGRNRETWKLERSANSMKSLSNIMTLGTRAIRLCVVLSSMFTHAV